MLRRGIVPARDSTKDFTQGLRAPRFEAFGGIPETPGARLHFEPLGHEPQQCPELVGRAQEGLIPQKKLDQAAVKKTGRGSC